MAAARVEASMGHDFVNDWLVRPDSYITVYVQELCLEFEPIDATWEKKSVKY